MWSLILNQSQRTNWLGRLGHFVILILQDRIVKVCFLFIITSFIEALRNLKIIMRSSTRLLRTKDKKWLKKTPIEHWTLYYCWAYASHHFKGFIKSILQNLEDLTKIVKCVEEAARNNQKEFLFLILTIRDVTTQYLWFETTLVKRNLDQSGVVL